MKMDVQQRGALPLPVYVIPVAMLGLALLPMPYGYYELLRLVVCLAAALIAAHDGKAGRWWFAAGFAVLALLYNPLFRIHLPRETWQGVNVATIAAFAAMWFMARKRA